MRDISQAVKYLESKGIKAVEGSGMLVIPCTSPEEIINLVSIIKRYLDEIGYDKSWLIDPYYYDLKMKGDRDYDIVKD